jgi:GAF domain-containing protein
MSSANDTQLPLSLKAVFESQHDLDTVFLKLMQVLCDEFNCDRCFLYLRNPQTQEGTITHCYSRDSRWKDMTSPDWASEGNVAELDPLFATALQTIDPVYVDDIETAGPDVLNLEFEREGFGHRALIHAPIYYDDQMFGILEPCVFEQPHHWTERDRQITAFVQAQLSSKVVTYLKQTNRIS